MGEELVVTAQDTPNPNAAKFTLNRTIVAQSATYRDAAAAPVLWAKELLAIAGVTQVFALNNFVTVNKTPDAEWGVIGPQIEHVLRRAFA